MSNETSSTDAGYEYKPPFLTFILIGLNVFIYIMIQYQGGPTYENLIQYGAKENGLIAEGELERLFLPMFLHASPAHILFNMFALYQFGRVFEVLTGAKNLFITYLLGGILGNSLSFAFTDSLSVGASSSLFALLLALYVLERYQQKINLESTGIKTRTSLGPIILINGFITFLIPNIDWASHLGGGIAGALLGTGLVMKHRVNVRVMSMVKYWRVDPSALKLKFYQKEGFYLSLLILFVFLAMTRIPLISFSDRVFGLGVLQATKTKIESRDEADLRNFNITVERTDSPASPDVMLQQAIAHLVSASYEPAVLLLQSLQRIHIQGLGTAEFRSQSTLTMIERAIDAAMNRQPLDPALVRALSGELTAVSPEPGYCEAAAKVFHGIGFHSISGLLFQCAFYAQFGHKEFAKQAMADLWLEAKRCEDQIAQMKAQDEQNVYEWIRSRQRSCSRELNVFKIHLTELEKMGLLDRNGAVSHQTSQTRPR
jgi:rhomboid protease GluP